jgi:hypothetical protein
VSDCGKRIRLNRVLGGSERRALVVLSIMLWYSGRFLELRTHYERFANLPKPESMHCC